MVPRLVTLAQIATLYSQRPWDILDRPIALVSFRPTGRFQALVAAYRDFKDHHRQVGGMGVHPCATNHRRFKPREGSWFERLL